MAEDRFTSLPLLHIEGKLSPSIDAHDAVAQYAKNGNLQINWPVSFMP